MLQPRNISKVLSQLLSPTPEITDSKPLTASLVSISSCQPIISCTSRAFTDSSYQSSTSYSHSHSPVASGRTTATNSSSSVSSGSNPVRPNTLSNRTMSSLGFYGSTALAVPANDDEQEQLISSGGTSTNTVSNSYIPQHESIEDIEQQISNLQQQDYAASYVKLNLNPIDNLKIISVVLVKKWKKEAQTNKPYSIVQFGEYHLFLYQVNQEYLLLLSCDLSYPKALAIKRMEYVVQFLSSKL